MKMKADEINKKFNYEYVREIQRKDEDRVNFWEIRVR